MKNVLLAGLIALASTGCVVYPAHHPRAVYADTLENTVIYEGVEYYYDPTPVYVAGEVAIGLYFVDRLGHRHYHNVPRSHWRGPYPVRHH
jgi:hypothetical protein